MINRSGRQGGSKVWRPQSLTSLFFILSSVWYELWTAQLSLHSYTPLGALPVLVLSCTRFLFSICCCRVRNCICWDYWIAWSHCKFFITIESPQSFLQDCGSWTVRLWSYPVFEKHHNCLFGWCVAFRGEEIFQNEHLQESHWWEGQSTAAVCPQSLPEGASGARQAQTGEDGFASDCASPDRWLTVIGVISRHLLSEDNGAPLECHDGGLWTVTVHGQHGKANKNQESAGNW